MRTRSGALQARRFRFVLLLGVVSLFADMTYEGARSVLGPFMEYSERVPSSSAR